MKATAAYLKELKAPASVCAVMCGKYVEVSSAQARSLSGSLGMSALLASFTGKLPQFTNAGTTTVAGREGQVLRGPDGSRLVVAATGTPYPLQAVGAGSRRQAEQRHPQLQPVERRAPAGRAAGQPGDQSQQDHELMQDVRRPVLVRARAR